MKLIYIRSTMESKNYSTIRSILKKEQGEKIAPYIFKINDTQTLEAYLRKEWKCAITQQKAKISGFSLLIKLIWTELIGTLEGK